MNDTSAQKRLDWPDYRQTAVIMCDWKALRTQLMLQWERITTKDLEETGPNRRRIARLIERKYGIAADMVEKYLSNFEKTMPMAANTNLPLA